MNERELSIYLGATEFIDHHSSVVRDFVETNWGSITNPREKIIAMYYWVRDSIMYDFYSVSFEREKFKASEIINQQKAFCIPKAILLTAFSRAAGIPARLGFADVCNHLATEKLLKQIKTDIFVFHGYSEIYLEGKWIKATPAFNISLCEKFNVKPLEFDGFNDSIFHEFDKSGEKHMEYLIDHGSFPDLPYEKMITAFQQAYPHLFGKDGLKWPHDY